MFYTVIAANVRCMTLRRANTLEMACGLAMCMGDFCFGGSAKRMSQTICNQKNIKSKFLLGGHCACQELVWRYTHPSKQTGLMSCCPPTAAEHLRPARVAAESWLCFTDGNNLLLSICNWIAQYSTQLDNCLLSDAAHL
jgi:hypothetical protein